MIDLQKKPKRSNTGLVVAGVGVVALGVLAGGYWAWGAVQENNVKQIAAGAAKAGMAITRTQAKARISVAEAGTHSGDWTDTPVSPSGYSCSVLNRGDLQTGYAWNVYGQGDDLIRITIGPRSGSVASTTPEAKAMMRRLLDAAAPEAPEATKTELADAVAYVYGGGDRREAFVGGAKVSFSTDRKGEISRMNAEPVG